MLIRPKLEYSSPIWNPHTFSQVKSLERVQHSAARFVKNDYRRNTNPADLITALGWPTLEQRRIIKQATTFYKMLNNIIEITPPPGLLTRSRTRGQYIAPKCRINAMVFSFYPRARRGSKYPNAIEKRVLWQDVFICHAVDGLNNGLPIYRLIKCK